MAKSEQEVTEAIKASLRVVDEAAVPEDLRGLAFEKAFTALTGAERANESGLAPAAFGSEPDLSDASPALRLATRLGIDGGLVARVLDFDSDGVHIIVPRSRFARQKSAAIQQVALLIVAARQATGIEEWTSQSLVREASEALGVEDPSNFAVYMKRLEGIRARGSGRTGELKMNSVGFEAAGITIRQLAEEGMRK